MNRLDTLIANALPGTGAEVGRKLNRPSQNVYRALHRLERELKVSRDHNGVYTWRGSVPTIKDEPVLQNPIDLPKWYEAITLGLTHNADKLIVFNDKESRIKYLNENGMNTLNWCNALLGLEDIE